MASILYFASVREAVGHDEEHVSLTEPLTVSALIDMLCRQSPAHHRAFSDTKALRCAVNAEFASLDTLVRPGDEVAFFPPVTGGHYV